MLEFGLDRWTCIQVKLFTLQIHQAFLQNTASYLVLLQKFDPPPILKRKEVHLREEIVYKLIKGV